MTLEWKDVYREKDSTPYKGEHYRVAGSYVCDGCDNIRCTLIQEFGDSGKDAFPLQEIYGHRIRMPCPFERQAVFEFERAPGEDDPSWKDSGLPSYRERLDADEAETAERMKEWHERNEKWEKSFAHTRAEVRDGRPTLVVTMPDGTECLLGEGGAYMLEYELRERLDELKRLRSEKDGEDGDKDL